MPMRLPTPPASQTSFADGLFAKIEDVVADRRNFLRRTTARVGGVDGDSHIPTKYSRMTTPPDSARSFSPSKPIAIETGKAMADEPLADQQSSDDLSDVSSMTSVEAEMGTNATRLNVSDPDISQSARPIVASYRELRLSARQKIRQDAGRCNQTAEKFLSGISPSPGLEAIDSSHERSLSPQKGDSGQNSKRLRGRRRAPHANADIEDTLQRQLELKVSYRAVTKALKPILAELARRTVQELEADTEMHKNYAEFDEVEEELSNRLHQRLRLVNASMQLEETRLKRAFEAEIALISASFEASFCSDYRGSD